MFTKISKVNKVRFKSPEHLTVFLMILMMHAFLEFLIPSKTII